MDFKIGILAILAVLCVVLAAAAVSATDDVDQGGDYYFDGYQHDHDGDFIPLGSTNDGSQQAAGGDYYLDGSEDGHNGTIIPPDAGHNEEKMLNQTARLLVKCQTQTAQMFQHTVQAQPTQCLQPVIQS